MGITALKSFYQPRQRLAASPAQVSQNRKVCCPRARQLHVPYATDGAATLKSALSGDVDAAYQEGSVFLKSLDPDISQAEIARVLDIAMNPNSIFVSFRERKRAKNANARRLSVRDDMEPVVDFLIAKGFTHKQVAATIVEHPPILSYSVTNRLQPFVDCLADVGIDDAARVIYERPSLLGLNAGNVRTVVDYLQSRGDTQEMISEYLRKSI